MITDRKSPAEFLPPRPEPKPDGLRFKTCAVCGQVYDIQSLDQVYHHDARPHAPLRAL